jgi:hypothetical protein
VAAQLAPSQEGLSSMKLGSSEAGSTSVIRVQVRDSVQLSWSHWMELLSVTGLLSNWSIGIELFPPLHLMT